jgi:hypothetical protein
VRERHLQFIPVLLKTAQLQAYQEQEADQSTSGVSVSVSRHADTRALLEKEAESVYVEPL